ncbi:MAG: glycosyl hydrolase 53 family protein [Breznakibacter sp.]
MILRQLLTAALVLLSITACGDTNDQPDPGVPTEESTFAKGADISWVTEMEKNGVKFYNANGRETECMALMKEVGMNSIRLRVWVNPADGWCNKSDLLVKAIRAKNLGMRIMVDFHYSDVWADPGSQTKPAAWEDFSFDELKTAVANHTDNVLTLLKNNGVTPEWVQVGNETGNGMLWDDGKASASMAQYAALNNAGYDAVKAVFPDAKVIVHLQGGQDNNLYKWLFDGLKNNGGKWDVIGMSLYPETDKWQEYNDNCIANINDMISRYGSEVMICEVGMSWDEAATAKLFLTDLVTRTKAIADDKCLGVFYWEPQSYNSWNGYTLGAFDASGKPTVALDAFK